MAQYDFGTIDPNTKSGTALASDLNSYRNAVNSMHSGSSAPSYITAGMMWVDTTSADYEVKLYDGAQSITVAIIDATNNVARVAVDSAETSFITSTTAAQIRHVIASTNIFTTRSTGIQFNLASPVIADSNNNELISFTTTASAVNQLNLANSATGGAVDLSAVGTDANISIALTPKGTGGVGIGTTSPTAGYRLSVNGQAQVGDGGGNADINFNATTSGRFLLAGTVRMSIDSAGAVNVGDGGGNADINFNATTIGRFLLAGTVRMSIDSAGAVTIANLAGVGSRAVNASAAGLLSAASDSRLKHEVTDAPIPGLAEVMQLEPRAYKWLDDIEKRGESAAIEIGFFADQVKDIIPSAAPMGNDGYYGFYDRSVIAALTKGMQQQQAIITALESRLAALETLP
jgi:hypothetical protein